MRSSRSSSHSAAKLAGAAFAACLLLPGSAAAQAGLTLTARGFAGYTHERPEVLGSEHDVWTAGNPEISYLVVEPRWLLRATYGATATLHTRNPNELAHRFQLLSSYELSQRTQAFLFGEVRQSSLSTYLFTTPTASTTVFSVTPRTNTNVFTATAGQGLAWEASPVVLATQSADVAYITTIDAATPLSGLFANVGLGAERLWKNDAVGVDVRGGYAVTEAPPLPTSKFLVGTLAPRWRHDWSPAVSSSLAAGASYVTTPDGGSDPYIAPFGRASVLYTPEETTTIDLSYAGGIAPNLLSGQLLESHQVSARLVAPLSTRDGVFMTGSVGYLRGQVLVLDDAVPEPPPFDAFLSDFDVSWLVTDHVSVFGRYQFFGQFGGPGNSFLREAVIVGVQVSSQPPDGVRIPTRFAQRVDRSDAPLRPR